MTEALLKEAFQKFNDLRVLVVGDVMIDSYLWGKVDRISPEAPVPVVRITKKEKRLGGAANVALNIASLGARPIICAISGEDTDGQVLKTLIEERGMSSEGIFSIADRPTTVKTRVISNSQHIVRVDEESLSPMNSVQTQGFFENIQGLMESEKPDLVLFEDYNKGALNEELIEKVILECKSRKIPTAVDPKKDNFFAFKGVTLFKPNLKELGEGLKLDIDKKSHQSLDAAVDALEEILENEISLITLSEEGVLIKRGDEIHRIPAHFRNISDVSGAGDTVISTAALCLALGLPLKTIASLSNLAGGLVCEKVGVVPIEKSQLLEEAVKNLNQL